MFAVSRGRRLRRLAALPLWPLVAGYMLLSDVLWPAIRPLVQALARIQFVQRLRDWVVTLPPYAALLALAVPFVVLEPIKLLGLFWMATGHIVLGTTSLIAAHGASLLSTERLFGVLKPRLLTIGWFAVLWGWVEWVRDTLVWWVRSTWAWRRLHEVFGHIRLTFARLLSRSSRT